MSIEDRIKQIMAKALRMSEESIDADTTSDGVDTWDSLAHVDMVMALEDEFDINFTGDETEEILSYAEILDAVTSKVSTT